MSAENTKAEPTLANGSKKKPKWLESDPTSSVKDMARQALEAHLQHVPSILESLVKHRFGVPDQVRQLRVATRRASTAVNLFAEFATTAATSQIARDLKKIRKVAGRMRDLDVLIANAEKGELASGNLEFLAARRSRAQLKLEKSYRKYIASGRLDNNVQRLLDSLDGNGQTPALFRTWASGSLREAGAVFFSSWPTTIQSSEGGTDFAALHNFRLQVKKIRYQIELLAADSPRKRRKKLNRKLKKIQTSLGEINDHDIAIQKIHRWMTGATAEQRVEFSRQLANEQAARAVAARSFHEKWPLEARDKVQSLFDRMIRTRPPASDETASQNASE